MPSRHHDGRSLVWATRRGTSGTPPFRTCRRRSPATRRAFLAAARVRRRAARASPRRCPSPTLLDALQSRERGVRARLLERTAATRRPRRGARSRCEHVALTRIAAGYSAGLGRDHRAAAAARGRVLAGRRRQRRDEAGRDRRATRAGGRALPAHGPAARRCSSWPSHGGGEERHAAGKPGGAGAARDRRLPAREPAPLRQRRSHRRRRLPAGAAGHQPARARRGGGAPAARDRARAPAHGEPQDSPSRSRTTTSWTSNAQEMLVALGPEHASARSRQPIAGLSQPRSPWGASMLDRQSVTGRPSASAARRTISRSLG